MSVAEALGQEVRSPNIEVRRQRHFIGLNNDQPRLIPFELSPRLAMFTSDQSDGGPVSKNFRLKGYTSQYMMTPRQPMVAPASEDRRKNEEKLRKYFGKPSMFELSPSETKDVQTNREPLALRKLEDIYSNRREEEIDKIRRERKDMEEEKQRLEDKRSREIQDKENERKQTFELNNNFLWDQRSFGHGGPNMSGNNRRRQFVDKDSGPFYQEKREYESKPFHLYDPDHRSESQTPFELQEYSKKLNQVSEQKKFLKQQKENMYDHSGMNLDDQTREDNYHIKNNFESNRYPEEKRSLDLDHTRGGGGAPVKDDRGKSVTRRPITLSRDDYGETRIREDFNRNNNTTDHLTERESLYSADNKPYFPWGGSGAGAPIRDREGKVITQVFGKLEGKTAQDDDYRREKLRKEVLFNELREVEKQQKENKEELKRYMKAPQVEMAELLAAGRVGKPKRDELTGVIGQQHLGHSDVSKVKTNYQPKPDTEKRQYHDELVRMAEERQYQKLLDKFKDRQEANAHFQNMDSSWGQFGGGAPKHEVIRKKVNLTNALYYPDQGSDQPSSRTTGRPVMEDPVVYPAASSYNPPTGLGSFEFMEQAHHNPGYQKRYVEDDQRQYHSPENSPRYLKNTINSSHKNLYQTTSESRVTGRSGQTVAPYATGIF